VRSPRPRPDHLTSPRLTSPHHTCLALALSSASCCPGEAYIQATRKIYNELRYPFPAARCRGMSPTDTHIHIYYFARFLGCATSTRTLRAGSRRSIWTIRSPDRETPSPRGLGPDRERALEQPVRDSNSWTPSTNRTGQSSHGKTEECRRKICFVLAARGGGERGEIGPKQLTGTCPTLPFTGRQSWWERWLADWLAGCADMSGVGLWQD